MWFCRSDATTGWIHTSECMKSYASPRVAQRWPGPIDFLLLLAKQAFLDMAVSSAIPPECGGRK